MTHIHRSRLIGELVVTASYEEVFGDGIDRHYLEACVFMVVRSIMLLTGFFSFLIFSFLNFFVKAGFSHSRTKSYYRYLVLGKITRSLRLISEHFR